MPDLLLCAKHLSVAATVAGSERACLPPMPGLGTRKPAGDDDVGSVASPLWAVLMVQVEHELEAAA